MTVGGTVKAADGRPVAGAEVMLLPLAANYEQSLELLAGRLAPAPAATVRTDRRGPSGHDVAARRQVAADYQGGFRIEDLLPGAYRLEVASSRELITESRDLRLEGDLDLVIEITTAEVSGLSPRRWT